jgi:hypothetical protein
MIIGIAYSYDAKSVNKTAATGAVDSSKGVMVWPSEKYKMNGSDNKAILSSEVLNVVLSKYLCDNRSPNVPMKPIVNIDAKMYSPLKRLPQK